MMGTDRIRQEAIDKWLIHCEKDGIDFDSHHTTITFPKVKE